MKQSEVIRNPNYKILPDVPISAPIRMTGKEKNTGRLSIKRNRLLRHIPTSNTIREAADKAGYSRKSNNTVYNESIKKYILGRLEENGYSKDIIRKEFERILRLCEGIKDYGNGIRCLENLAKIQGLFNDSVIPNFKAINVIINSKDKINQEVS